MMMSRCLSWGVGGGGGVGLNKGESRALGVGRRVRLLLRGERGSSAGLFTAT